MRIMASEQEDGQRLENSSQVRSQLRKVGFKKKGSGQKQEDGSY